MARPNIPTHIKIEDRPVQGNDYLRVEVSYWKGRGIYLEVNPITIENGIMSCILGRAQRDLLEPATRFNARKLEHWAVCVPQHHQTRIEALAAKVLGQGKSFPSEIH